MTNAQLVDVREINARLESAEPQAILRWAIEEYRDRLTMATAFGAEGCCLIAMIAAIRAETGFAPDIFNLETGYQFPETLALRDRLQEKYGLPIRFVRSRETVAQMEERFGGPIYGTDPDHCCYLRKVVPLREALRGYDAWITALRRDQTPERANAPVVGWDDGRGMVKINPLANWTKTQVWDYVRAHDVPTNPLHERGYPSIGCWPCTRPVRDGNDERAGRWAGTAKRECGLHLSPDGLLPANGHRHREDVMAHRTIVLVAMEGNEA
jgi:phosphoadenosine phosphosulfate reductase